MKTWKENNINACRLKNDIDGNVNFRGIIIVTAVLMMLLISPFTGLLLSNEPDMQYSPPEPTNIEDIGSDTGLNDAEEPYRTDSGDPQTHSTRAKGQTEDIVLFLHNVTDSEPSKTLPGSGSTWNWFDTEANFNIQNTTLEATGTSNIFDWYLAPALAENLTTDQVTLKIWVKAGGGTAANVGVSIEIFERDSTGTEISVKKNNFGNQQFEKTGTLKTWTVTFDSPHEFAKGSSIKVRIDSNPGAGKYAYFYYDSPAANSRIVIPTSEHMEIQSVSSLDYQETIKVNFDQIVSNKTIHFRVNVLDPFGGYDINFVGLTLTDPDDSIILNNVSMSNYSGTPISYLSVFTYTWNYSAESPGRYNISVLVIDNNGYNNYNHFALFDFGYYPDRMDSYFYIGDLPKYVWIKTLDNMSNVLDGARVFAEFAGGIVTENTTSSNGMANITVYPANYNIIVKWQGVVVAIQPYNVFDNVSAIDPVIVACQVYYPTIKTIDNSSIDLSDATLYITHPNGTSLQPLRTDEIGTVNYSQMAGGDYDIVVRWRGVEVNISTVTIDGNGNFIIKCWIFYITFRTVDTTYNNVENIGVTVFDSTTAWVLDFKISNMSGIAVTRVPLGVVDVVAYWQNIVVNTTLLVSITGDGSIVIVCNIFSINVKIIDSRSIPVEDAQIIVRVNQGGDVIDSGITDDVGEVDMHLLAGTYYLEVYWHTVQVSSRDIIITNVGQKIVQADIYYVNFNTVDALSNIVSEAQIYIYSSATGTLIDSARSNESGVNELRLPRGNIDLEVYWKTVLVNSSKNILIDDDIDPFVIDLWVYYITFNIIDSMGKPIANAQISVNLNATTELADSGTTDKDGGLTIRLPMTFVDISIIWDKAVIYRETMYNVSGNSVKQISAWVYYVTFNTIDSKDKAVSGVQIEVISDIDGETTYIQTSDSLGLTTFRLPLGGYELNAYWQTVLVRNIQDIDVAGDLGFYILQLWIYYVNFATIDSRDNAVPNAQITFTTNLTQEAIETKMTDSSGIIEVRLPVGSVDVDVFWKEVKVLEQSVMVTQDVPVDSLLVLSCNIYYLTTTAVDSKNVPIADAKVTITRDPEGSIMDSLTTGETGLVVSRLPMGEYSITVDWFDVEVFIDSGITIDKDVTRNLDCNVFYITIVAEDSNDIEVEDARIMLSHIEASKLLFTNITDEFGLIQVRVPIGAYEVNIFWQNVLVFTGSYYFNKDDTVNIRCNIFYITIKTEDSENIVLTNAQTVLLLSDSQKVMATNNSGTGEMEFRLPTADYDILVYWRDVLVKSELVYSIKSSHSVTLVCNVFYFDVYALDVDSIPLENANILIESHDSGEVYDTMVSDAEGYGGSKIPIGAYDISIFWKEIRVFSALKYDINISERYEKICNVFYLTIKVVDKNNEPIKDVSIEVLTGVSELNEHQYTNNKGVAEFRLPVENYEINGRLQTNYLLKKIDEKKSSTIGLNTKSETVTIKFSEYPPSFFATPAFYGVTLPIILLLVILFLIWHFFLRKRKATDEGEDVDDDHVVIPDTHRYKPIKGMKYDKLDSDSMDDEEPESIDDEPEAETEAEENGQEQKEE